MNNSKKESNNTNTNLTKYKFSKDKMNPVEGKFNKKIKRSRIIRLK
jgi:hypothetical protein